MENSLNSLFFADNKLIPAVSENLKEVTRDVLIKLSEDDFNLNIFVGLILTGSMLTASWDEHSDLDLHIVFDESLSDEPLTENDKSLLWHIADQFNQNEFEISNTVVEVYFQGINDEHNTCAIYNVMADEWISESSTDALVFTDEIKEFANQYTIRINDFLRDDASDTRSYPDKLKTLMTIKTEIYPLRKIASTKYTNSEDFVSSFENMAFKWVKRSGTLDKLLKLIQHVTELTYND